MNRVLLVLILLSLTLSVAFAESGRAIAILLDVSKSVPAEDLQKAKSMTKELIAGASPNDTITIYAFGSEFRKVEPDELDKIESTESYTLLYDSAFDVARDLQKTQAARKAILIVTDGLDTKSATVLEDTVHFANENGISIYGIGVGKVNRKSLERISKLTGGQYLSIDTPSLVQEVASNIGAQDEVKKPELARTPSSPSSATPSQAPPPAEPLSSEKQTPVKPKPGAPAPESRRNLYLWIGGGIAGVVLLVLVILLIASSVRKEQRLCPTCGRELEAYQTICPECSKAETTMAKRPEVPADGTQEFGPAGVEEDDDLIPVELLEKRPVSEESLTKTFVLMETPMLVVRKGKNLGQSFALNRAFPVSIGRSRVNEIRLDDITVSGQHCRIIPETGGHVLYDLGSTNGTLVNDKKATKVILKEGDIIKVGETQFLYKVEQHRS